MQFYCFSWIQKNRLCQWMHQQIKSLIEEKKPKLQDNIIVNAFKKSRELYMLIKSIFLNNLSSSIAIRESYE
jgi:hypothetical protein